MTTSLNLEGGQVQEIQEGGESGGFAAVTKKKRNLVNPRIEQNMLAGVQFLLDSMLTFVLLCGSFRDHVAELGGGQSVDIEEGGES